MYIEEVIIEGFKSYATRTVISGWDREFNAITGLNGSGKSNILDAICFVLGISNLSQVRAVNLQDLIYKRGQAGISKATVTIVFNNNETKTSPFGYEQFKQITVARQVLMGGKTKYLINGHVTQQRSIMNLFQSVQLNVNNPHFLIMQGKITKVLNMKPPEILAMVEEAAGTRMFEDKKESATKIIEKKDKKLDDITKILDEYINPDLQKKRKERTTFLEYQRVESDIERLMKFCLAHTFMSNEEILKRNLEAIQKCRVHSETLQAQMKHLKQDIERLQSQLRDLTAKRQNEMGGNFSVLEKKVQKLSEQLVRLTTQSDLKKESLQEETKRHEKLTKHREHLETNLSKKSVILKELHDVLAGVKASVEERNLNLKRTEETLQALQTGLSETDGSDGSYLGRFHEAKTEAQNLSTELRQIKIKVEHMKKELEENEQKSKKLQGENKHLPDQRELCVDELKNLESKLVKIGFDATREDDLKRLRHQKKLLVDGLQQEADELKSHLKALEFTYSDPSPNFDRRKVKGLVVNVIKIEQENFEWANALEICAGNRLFNLIVEDETVGSQLIEKGQLKKRVTIIPLNKISKAEVDPQRVEAAKSLAPGMVDVALSFIGYADDVREAVEYVFGSTLLCQNKEVARLVTFDKNVRTRSVTIDGDVYDPAGTLTGGSKSQSGSILMRLQEYKIVEKQLVKEKAELLLIEKELASLATKNSEHTQISRQLELKSHQKSLLDDQIRQSPAFQILSHIEKLRDELLELSKVSEAVKSKEKIALQKVASIEIDIAELSKDRNTKLGDIEKSISQLKKDVSEAGKKLKSQQEVVQGHEIEHDQLRDEITSVEESLLGSKQQMELYENEHVVLVREIETIENEHSQSKRELQKENDALIAQDKEIKQVETFLKIKKDQLTDYEFQIKKLEHEESLSEKDAQVARETIETLEKDHEWIAQNKHLFGVPDSAYDFVKNDPREARKRLDDCQERQSQLRRVVNMKVMSTIDRLEKEENSLKQKLAIVTGDKNKITETIATLDEKKREALLKTWQKVNSDFGAIFHELLPGNTAKLVPCEGKEINEGLEVKVCLGSVWKDSLTELSGGQRSLIALSLILSLLQFKPAPMYILDEVDAALDLSHTQNIGQLFRHRFKGSQFIVVSLKEGMFNNANVLFRARFRDGVSSVERLTQNSQVPSIPHTQENSKQLPKRSLGKARLPDSPR